LKATTVTQSEDDTVEALRCWLSFVSSDSAKGSRTRFYDSSTRQD